MWTRSVSQHQIVRLLEPASFWRENLLVVVIGLLVLCFFNVPVAEIKQVLKG